MPKVSVIIPVYNTEKYLPECIDSIINQTLEDIEIICINDGSSDNSLTVLEEYAKKDDRIKIYSKKNEGPANTRNLGLKKTKGEYIAFLDSDDCIKNNTHFETLYKLALENSADIVKSKYEYMQTNLVYDFINDKIKKDKNNFCSEYCSAIFKSDFIKNNNFSFPLLIDMEDPVFTYSCALKANKVTIANNEAILIRKREGSLTYNPPNFKQIADKIKGLEIILNLYEQDEKSYTLGFWFGVVLFDCLRNKDFLTGLYYVLKLQKIYNKIKKYKEVKITLDELFSWVDIGYENLCSTFLNDFIKSLFSIKNEKRQDRSYKVIAFLGMKFKIKRRNK